MCAKRSHCCTPPDLSWYSSNHQSSLQSRPHNAAGTVTTSEHQSKQLKKQQCASFGGTAAEWDFSVPPPKTPFFYTSRMWIATVWNVKKYGVLRWSVWSSSTGFPEAVVRLFTKRSVFTWKREKGTLWFMHIHVCVLCVYIQYIYIKRKDLKLAKEAMNSDASDLRNCFILLCMR